MLEIIEKSLYPKTKRIADPDMDIVITEKLDGSNLGIFRVANGLLFAQRNYYFIWDQGIEVTEEQKEFMYKGLYDWINEVGTDLLNKLRMNTGMFGEYFGNHSTDEPTFINYDNRSDIDKKFYMFAKANIVPETLDIRGLNYKHDLFKYVLNPFKVFPDYIGIVPVVAELTYLPTVEQANKIYYDYVCKVNGVRLSDNHLKIDIESLPRKVEGMVIIRDGSEIKKYVRLKAGVFEDHKQPSVKKRK